jgi:iron complex transport system substrate-binding protein
MRIVSLACSNTEIVHALGRAHDLVAVDDHSDHPHDVIRDLPRVGPELEIDIEAVTELAPDLVLASLTVPGHEEVVEGLERAGLPYLAPEPVSLQDVFRDIRTVATVLGEETRGREVVEEMMEGIQEVVARSGPLLPPFPSVLIQWWPKPVIAPGRQSWVQDLFDLVGLGNPLGTERVKSRPLSRDEVARMDPDAIVLSWCGVDPADYRPDVVYETPEWSDVPAIRNGEVHCVPEAYLGRPGPRLVEGALALLQVKRSLEETS